MASPSARPPTELSAWQALAEHHRDIAGLELRDLFARDPRRFERFSARLGDLLFDYSKHRVTERTRTLFCQLADEADLREWIERLFTGETVNVTEERAVLHTALRNPEGSALFLDGKDVMPGVFRVKAGMRTLANALGGGRYLGHTERPVTDVVNIGIGGSDLGPRMVTRALRPYWVPGLRVHFVSNVDGTHLAETLEALDPETTLFIVASKTFTTEETLANATSARSWLLARLGDPAAIARHFVAISANPARAAEFGVDPAQVFEFWDWVGGRYSLWSAIGLPIACAVGMDRFEELLAGAHEADEHFRHAPFGENIPALMGFLGVWYRSFFGISAHAILPYDQSLEHLPAYLQQADMESNGKSVDREGRGIDAYRTGPVVFGEPGTNGQHAFYQLLHQGTELVPADFLIPAVSHHALGDHHARLVAHCFAQSEALMRGRTREEVAADLEKSDLTPERMAALLPHKVFSGNRPSSTLLFRQLTPRTLGRLIAIYEHKIFVEGILWNINSFDQWGVELGKKLASVILPELSGPIDGAASSAHDASTSGLIRYYKELCAAP